MNAFHFYCTLELCTILEQEQRRQLCNGEIKVIESDHARLRKSQRNVSDLDVSFIMKNATLTRRAGARFYQLHNKDIPANLPPNDRRWKLVGTTVLTCKCGQMIITVYRNDRAFKKDQRKQKYDSRQGLTCRCQCSGKIPCCTRN